MLDHVIPNCECSKYVKTLSFLENAIAILLRYRLLHHIKDVKVTDLPIFRETVNFLCKCKSMKVFPSKHVRENYTNRGKGQIFFITWWEIRGNAIWYSQKRQEPTMVDRPTNLNHIHRNYIQRILLIWKHCFISTKHLSNLIQEMRWQIDVSSFI